MYARVLSHDLFGEFVKSGDLMNKEVAMRYREMILEKGSSKNAEDMVNAFLGREYSFKAYEEWLSAGVRKVDG
jgi:thimet oligopeptidase